MQWTREDPARGNMGTVGALKNQVVDRKDLLVDLRGQVNDAVALVEGRSSAIAGWTAKISGVGAQFGALTTWFSSVQSAAATYVEGVEALDAEVEATRSARATADGERLRYARLMDYHEPDSPSYASYQNAVWQKTQEIRDLDAKFDEYAATRSALDSAFVEALDLNPSSALIQRVANLETLYGSDAMQGTYAQYVEARQQRIDDMVTMINAAGDHANNPEVMQELSVHLSELAGDPYASGRVWDTVGGAEAYTLMGKIGEAEYAYRANEMLYRDMYGDYPEDGEPSAFANVLGSIRDSISAGSTTWTQGESRSFATGMLRDWPADEDWRIKPVDRIAYLFNSPETAPMSPTFAGEVATILDDFERRAAQEYGANPVTAGLYELDEAFAFTEPGPSSLSNLTSAEDYASAQNNGTVQGRYRDPMALTLTALSADSDASLAWLSDDSAGAAHDGGETRREHLFGTRTWERDDYSGISDVFHSAMDVEGGFMAAGQDVYMHELDQGVLKEQAGVFMDAVQGFGDTADNGFEAGNLHGPAQEKLGEVLAANMPWVVEGGVMYSPGPGEAGTVQDFEIYGLEGTLPTPVLDDTALGKVWGTVGATDEGFSLLNNAANATSEQLFQTAEATGGGAGEDLVREGIAVQSFHQASMGGVEVLHGRLQDEAVNSSIGAVGTLSSVIPTGNVPGLLVSVATSGASETASHFWAGNLDTAMNSAGENGAAGRLAVDGRLELMADTFGWSQQDIGTMLQGYDDKYMATLGAVGDPKLAGVYEDLIPE